MNIERAAMKSKLAGLNDEKKTLIVRAEIVHEDLRRELNTALIAVDDTDIARVLALFENFQIVHTDLAKTNGEIAKLERALG